MGGREAHEMIQCANDQRLILIAENDNISSKSFRQQKCLKFRTRVSILNSNATVSLFQPVLRNLDCAYKIQRGRGI